MNASTLLLDLGNSAGKWICRSADGALHRGAAKLPDLVSRWKERAPAQQVLVSSVASADQEKQLESTLLRGGCAVWFARPRARLGHLVNAYERFESIGVDRWLAMVGARNRCDGAFCVIDAGSALTIDVVDAAGLHRGGYILPGLRMMEQALLRNTERVRFSQADTGSLQPGTDTASAVGRGLLLAQCGAIELALRTVVASVGNPRLFVCGGDAPVLVRCLPREVELRPDLVFEGLEQQAIAEGVLADVVLGGCSPPD